MQRRVYIASYGCQMDGVLHAFCPNIQHGLAGEPQYLEFEKMNGTDG